MDTEDESNGYCQFCRTSRFNDFDKHLRTNLHKTNWSKALSKMQEKIALAKRTFDNPVVTAVSDAVAGSSDDKFWCHVCNEEFFKHWITDEDNGSFSAALNGGVVGHFASELHRSQIVIIRKRFRSQMSCDQFALPKTILAEFAERVSSAYSKCVRDRDSQMRLAATKLSELETSRTNLVVATKADLAKSQKISFTTMRTTDAEDIHPNEYDVLKKLDSDVKMHTMDRRQRKRLKQRFKKKL